MKTFKYNIRHKGLRLLPFYLFTFLLLAASCSSDDDMTRLNTDPTKAPDVDASAQLTTAELQTYGDLGEVELNRNYIYGFTQQLAGSWNTTNYGGRQMADDNEMQRMWTTWYNQSIKNLVDAINKTDGDETQANVNAASKIYFVYMMSVITDTYGNVPYTEAGRGYINNIANPKYDDQKDIYYNFFEKLDSAVQELNANGGKISSDVIYQGDITKWKKLANSLRLRYAMRISDVDPEKAQAEFTKALQADGGIIDNSSDDALIHYMKVANSFGQESYTDYRRNAMSMLFFGNDPANNPSYICSTFFNLMNDSKDPRTFIFARNYWDKIMNISTGENRIDVTAEVLAQGKEQPNNPGGFSWEPWPSGYHSTYLDSLAQYNPDITAQGTDLDRECEPKLANNFLSNDNPGVVITSAEVKFLLAEATSKGWISSYGSVADLYREGVRASMDLLSDNYGTERVSDDDFNTFIQNNPVGYTAENQKRAINTQAYILHFLDPNECWANVRRSGYPQLRSASHYNFTLDPTSDGDDIPVRLKYPTLESSYNKANYNDALQRMGGTDSWHTHVWWDVK